MRKAFSTVARYLMGTITHVSTSDSVAALTFDDGPHAEFTPRVLEILDRYKAVGTFFMTGEAAKQHPDLVREVAQAGHAIGNHSWDHSSFPLLTGKERRTQIRRCEEVVAPYGQKLFRPPYGHQNIASRLDLLWLGYRVITWNVNTRDWLDHDPNWIVERLMKKVQPGSVILFHDSLNLALKEGYAQRWPTIEAVNILLKRIGDQYRFVTIPKLLEHGRPIRQNWYKEADEDWLSDLKKIKV